MKLKCGKVITPPFNPLRYGLWAVMGLFYQNIQRSSNLIIVLVALINNRTHRLGLFLEVNLLHEI